MKVVHQNRSYCTFVLELTCKTWASSAMTLETVLLFPQWMLSVRHSQGLYLHQKQMKSLCPLRFKHISPPRIWLGPTIFSSRLHFLWWMRAVFSCCSLCRRQRFIFLLAVHADWQNVMNGLERCSESRHAVVWSCGSRWVCCSLHPASLIRILC